MLILEASKDLNFDEFYTHKEIVDDYGGKKSISEFKKMEFCEKICSLDDETLKKVLANLRQEIERLRELFL